MKVVLGVDGGGTKTECFAVEVASRKHVGTGRGGSGNWNSVGADIAFASMTAAMQGALDAAGASLADVSAICIASAGIDRPDDIAALTARTRDWFPGEGKILIHNDAMGALASGTGGALDGCVLIAGTGTIALGVSPDGRRARAAGWGPALGDSGSGHDIACRGLAACARAADGRGPATALLAAVLEHLELESPEALIGWAYAEPGWAHLASVAPVVLRCAEGGDAVARSIVDAAVEELAGSVRAVAEKLGLGGGEGGKFPLVLSGGILTKGGLVPRVLVERLSEVLPAAAPVHPEAPPAMGAALLAVNAL